MRFYIFLLLAFFSTESFAKGSKLPPEIPQESQSFKNSAYSKCINDVQKSLEKVSRKPRKYIDFKVTSKVFYSQNYRMSLFNKNTLGLDNHIQGLAKLNGTENFIISAGDMKRKEAHLFVVNDGKVIKKLLIGKGNLWHPGGISVAGNVLAVPNQAYKTKGPDFIQLYDVRDPKNPKDLLKFEAKIASSISLHRWKSNGKYLLLAGNGILISKTSNILDGFESRKEFTNKWFSAGNSQSIIEDCKTKELFLITVRNTARVTPIDPRGKDILTLYKLNLKEPGVFKIRDYEFKCGYMKCNFDSGTAIYIEDDKIKIRAVHHYRRWFGKKIRSGEFY